MELATCPVCNYGQIEVHKSASVYGATLIACPVCGKYRIDNDLIEDFPSMKTDPPAISAWIRNQIEINNTIPLLNTAIVDNLGQYPPKISTTEKQALLLRAIERRTEYPGAEVLLESDKNYPLAFARHSNEMNYLCKALEERGFISLDNERLKVNLLQIKILTKGWEYLDQLNTKPIFTDLAFVAMSFDKIMEPVWENAIKPAIESAGYKAHRVDKVEHLDRIDAKIISDIKDSLFVVADVTLQKQGVYFEAGYALGLNKPVIWTVQKDDLDKVHFDTRQYNHIVWETHEHLKEQLYYRICSVIGKRNL